jgi:hypothetical protein
LCACGWGSTTGPDSSASPPRRAATLSIPRARDGADAALDDAPTAPIADRDARCSRSRRSTPPSRRPREGRRRRGRRRGREVRPRRDATTGRRRGARRAMRRRDGDGAREGWWW